MRVGVSVPGKTFPHIQSYTMPDHPASLHGFTLRSTQTIAESDSIALLYEHTLTGAPVAFLLNDDDNKGFVIAFRTPPSDSTGVPHILEHSVLNGSARYPVKEPFTEIIRSSLNTFLNAFTYSDRTAYPVASRNDQDFRNLVRIYLDAVFAPLLAETSFMQEGWHHKLNDQDQLEVTGIVYNEMIGAYSSPENQLADAIYSQLYPGSIYAHSSGGKPENIPDLSFDEFLAFHEQFYSPTNSLAVFAGNVDVAESLAEMAEYLVRFAPGTLAPVPAIEAQAAPVVCTLPYSIGADEDAAHKTFVQRAWCTGELTPEQGLAWTILGQILLGSAGAPLRRALIESGLGQETMHWGLDGDVSKPNFSVGLKGTEPDKREAIELKIDETLAALVADGIDTCQVTAALNTIEFQLREANYGGFPPNLHDGLRVIGAWIYDAPLFSMLEYEAPLQAIRDGVTAGRYFETLIEQSLINNQHRVTIVLAPDTKLAQQQQEALTARLAAQRAALSDAGVARVRERVAKLERVQQTPDTPEALASIPALPRSAVKTQADVLPFAMIADDGPRLSFSERNTRGIAYVKLRFDAAAVPQPLFPYLGIFAKLLRETGTAKRDYSELLAELGIHTGGLSGASGASCKLADTTAVNPGLTFVGKALTHSVPQMFSLLREILTSARLDDLERVREIVRSVIANTRSAVVPSGNRYASMRLNAVHTTVGGYSEALSGLEQFFFLQQLEKRLATEPDAVLGELQQVRELVLRSSQCHVHVTGGAADLAAVQTELAALAADLPGEALPATEYSWTAAQAGEGWILPANVQYVGQGLNLYSLGLNYHAAFSVLSHLIDQEYLWNAVRVKGNAYGCSSQFDAITGQLNCLSYRDPHLEQTLEAYAGLPDFVQAVDLSASEYDRVLIGTMGGLDSPRTPDQEGSLAFRRHLIGVTQELVQQRRDEVLSSTVADFARFQDAIAEFANRGTICVFGSQEALERNKTRFSRIAPVL